MVGPIEILPPHTVHAGRVERAKATDPVAAVDAMTGRRGGTSPRPARVDVVIDIDAAGNLQPAPAQKTTASSAAGSGGQPRGRRQALPYGSAPEGRRSAYATAMAGTADKAALRAAGALAYRSADGLVADYAHRGTFFDLKV